MDGENKELKVLETIKEQVINFKEKLGEKADIKSIEGLNSQIEELTRKVSEKSDISDIDTRIVDINSQLQKLHNAVLQNENEELKEKETDNSNDARKARKEFIAKIEKFSKSHFDNDGNKIPNAYASIELKDAVEFNYSNTLVGSDNTVFTGRLIDPVLYQKRRKTNIILDYFDIQTTTVPELIFLRKIDKGDSSNSNSPGGAGWIACGTSKPLKSFQLSYGTASAEKVAIFNTIDDCLLQDIPSFLNWVRDDFAQSMDETINEGLLGNHAAGSNKPLGLKYGANTFSAPTAFATSIPYANEIDAIVAAAAAMRSARENPAIVFVSWNIFYKILILKDNNARYQNNGLVYVNNAGQIFIAGVQVVGADVEDIPDANFLMVGSDPGFKIYAYGGRVIETGLNADDFRKDKTSIRGYQKFISYLPEERENSIIYDTFATVITAIDDPQGDTGSES